jgi:copper oxidase (laccase) domain-containing protein
VEGDPVDARARLVDLPWTWLRQVHGNRVVVVEAPGDAAGEPADAAVTRASGAVLAVHAADCGPVAFVGRDGVAVAHVGWKGLEAGVIDATVEELGGPFRAYVGPLIGPECYEFGAEDLARLVDRFGGAVEGRTADGRPALDLGAAVRHELARFEPEAVVELPFCTSCRGDLLFSHRARRDVGRQAVLAWVGR